MDLALQGKNILITGGSRGIGKAIAFCFAEEGANISFCGRNQKDIKETVVELNRFGNKYMGYSADIRNKEEVAQWIAATTSELKGIDIVILNASALSGTWNNCIQTDLLGTLNTLDLVLPYLKSSSCAAITFISSKAASIGIPGAKPYGAVKAALVNYMKSLSLELGPFGIRVNTVSPGDTFFKRGYWETIKNNQPEEYKKAENSNSLKRLAKPEEIADCVAFVSSPRASFVSGANLHIDGSGIQHVIL